MSKIENFNKTKSVETIWGSIKKKKSRDIQFDIKSKTVQYHKYNFNLVIKQKKVHFSFKTRKTNQTKRITMVMI